MFECLHNKRVLVTGACGTIGSALVRRLFADKTLNVAQVIGIDNNESALFFLDQQYGVDARALFRYVDVRDRDTLGKLMRGVDVVFHAAALKHVALCETAPYEAVQTNIGGVQNLVHCAFENRVKRVIFTSSDKAVNPTNVMGTSKLMGERLITAANNERRGNGPVLASTRFGNVLGSNGSVVPLFRHQIERGGPVTLTHRDMTRFIMSVDEAVRLVFQSADLACGGEVFVTKMPVARIRELAEVLVEELAPQYGHDPDDIRITEIGVKPGEKMYEELMSHEETGRALELPLYFAILPAFRNHYRNIRYDYPQIVARGANNPYISSAEPPLDKAALRDILEQSGLLAPASADAPA